MKELVFTIDVEEWWHSENIREFVRDKSHTSLDFIYDVLETLEKSSAKGTFFWLSDVAENNKNLVKEVVAAGHEIASHGVDHKLLTFLDSSETRYQLQKSKQVLEELSGMPVRGFRSPCFSYNRFLDSHLIDLGYEYTSNGMYVSGHDRYGKPKQYEVYELPDYSIPTLNLLGLSVPVTGGGYFRLYPLAIQNYLVKKYKTEPIVFYCHPWDFDTKQPRIKNAPYIKKLRHSVGVNSAKNKLKKFVFSNKSLGDLCRAE